ncbi:hypothetical protein SK128_005746 [Halocaridina rubra]|uniref:Uncharacterized protein n=1 Tax=Halocaridina rubra TaxID=373956 RepID=A0AAN8WVM2_HALRR
MSPSLSQTSPIHGSVGGVAIRRLKQKIKNLEAMVISLDDKIRNMDGEMKENETLREQIRSLEEANKAQGQERKELEKRIKKLEGEKSQLESRISKQEDKNKQLNDTLKELDVSSLLSSERDEIAAWNVQTKENIEQFRKKFQELNMENDAMKTSFAGALKGNVAVKEAVKIAEIEAQRPVLENINLTATEGPLYPRAPSIVFGLGAIVAGIATIPLHETRGKPLPDTISDLERTTLTPAQSTLEEPDEETEMSKLRA